MGIINRTRDSFFDAGRTFALDSALQAVDRLVGDGADWLDVGAVPFSPLAEEVTESQEVDRIIPVVEAARARTDAVISVDTFRAQVAREAIKAGADAINDTSGLHDPALADLVAETGATLVITHSKAPPRTWLSRPAYADVVAEVSAFLRDRVGFALSRGVGPDQIIIDPGHDLNKNTYHSLELTRRLGELTGLGHPLLASVSNKDFIRETLNVPIGELSEGTIAAVVLCVAHGARVVRVHDVRAAVSAVRVAEAVFGWRQPEAPQHNLG
jgi:dihydropteroate synthase